MRGKRKKREKDDKIFVRDMANDFVVELVNDLKSYYHCDFDTVDEIFKITGYWDVINDNELACLAMSEYIMEDFIKMLERNVDINAILSRNGYKFK